MTPSNQSGSHHDLLHTDHPRVVAGALVLWFLAASLFFVMAVPALKDWIQGLDEAVWELMVDIEQSWITGMAEFFDLIGSSIVTIPVIVVVTGVLIAQRRWPALWSWLFAMGLSQALIGPMKNIYERPRPPLPLVETSSWSFPSGHAVAAAAVAVALVIAFTRPGPVRRNLAVAAAVFAFLMAFSRVYLRAHWLTDVTAGVALGSAAAITAAVVVHRVIDRRNRD